MKKLFVIIFLSLGLTACGMENSDRKDRQSVEAQQNQYSIVQPVPSFDWSLERDLTIQLYQARNEQVATHSVWRSDMGMVEGDCKSIGFGLPYDTSLTNPLKRAFGPVVVEQAEPNGIFASKNSNATWVMCVIETEGLVSTVPVYIESRVTVYPMSVMVDYTTNRVTFGQEKPSITIRPRQ